ncbi:CRISPR-associated transcriptional regulator Csa3 [Archaeoglobus fulgidus]|jgi:CRISPR-associated protein Csa3|uniref:Uncharacterized protein n=2 Tax=Archaeoglobus fulgidus TaxID=2234 RepID=O28410_ARCFU|nr:CRISPR-associated transcriptional regulator Csa3 [Archaeoglobus fulgidus]AAB89388.1 predicted coding region AF_1869 [Archaeoglobus fulgidus DSM 4304]KUJ92902.1 MAG: hypothetical protein XD40_1908 [Archaeoglobus fulgidus]KUK06332.1 MAG: hypothetical protein XD48_1429 [Archaeoglobus fulgidus]
MRTALIATLGFDEKFCYRAILRHGIKEGDRVILITTQMVERVAKAYEWIRKLLETSYGDRVEVEVLQVELKSVEKAIREVADKIKEVEGYDLVVVNISGGMRVLVVIVLLACMLGLPENLKVEIEKEDFSDIVELPVGVLKIVKSPLGDDKVEVLKAVMNGLRDVRGLSKHLGKDESTIRRHLAALEKMGLIEVKKRKPLIVSATELAGLIVP